MSTLPTELRNLLERTITNAREEAEKAARAALTRLAIHLAEPYATLSQEDRQLRNRLRAEARRLGEPSDRQKRDTVEPFAPLVQECAYEQWHRMLFARFLAENNLLMHPTGVAVTLEECGELAEEEGEPDAWMVAAKYAANMLPGIFRNSDPALQVRFDAAGRLTLERLLAELPASVFTAEDSLGWVYQFWQSRRKKEVNESGAKVGGADISPVTQLFTEPYMVQFLLHNSLGAWWVSRHPDSPLPISGEGAGGEGFLRRNADGKPAAGEFSGWPERTADLKVLDPCCGSGHFLVTAFSMLCRLRSVEEGLTEAEAGDAVLRDNLFGLELDPRCTQIAVFALALAAWKSGGYRELPLPNIACAGLPIGANPYEFTHLAEGESETEATLRQLHYLFQQAPDLGSLIDPERVAKEDGKTPYVESMFAPRWEEIAERLDKALAKERVEDPAAAIFGEAAQGVARAAELLTRRYNLVITNVPYLARGKQDAVLRKHIETYHNDAKADLATAFADRCLRFCTKGGSVALVTPQNWLFLGSYKSLRERLLKTATWNVVAKLGAQAFSTPMWDFNVGMFVLTNAAPNPEHALVGFDASAPRVPAEKAEILRRDLVHTVSQSAQLKNPDARIALEEGEGGALLEKYASAYQGIKTGDDARYRRCFWELSALCDRWQYYQSTVENAMDYGGLESVIDWRENGRDMARLQGLGAWKKYGVAVSQMGHLPIALYNGNIYDSNVSPVVPHNRAHLPAIWAFCSSPEFNTAVRRIDQKLNVTNATLVKVPFDLERWQKVAEEQYPNGLPEPHSDDPTQWLFHGSPVRSTDPLQVAVARLLGCRWPEQQGVGVQVSGVAEEKESVGKVREGVGEDQESVGAVREYVGEGQEGVGQKQASVGEVRESVGRWALGVGEERESVGKGQESVGEERESVSEEGLEAFADDDGIVCLPPVLGELSAAERLRTLLFTAFAAASTDTRHPTPDTRPPSPNVWLDRLLADAGYGGKGLDEWLRDGFFAAHCKRFHNRPFIWHVWDGRKDGFSALLNYHKLDRPCLERLTYTYLGRWIQDRREEDSRGVAGANARLVAALALQEKLKLILEGEPPYDLYIRWKPLHQHPLGWDPDLNDGVRLNVRPFVNAGILRARFTVHWNKDRGTNPDGSERLNDLHFTRTQKEAARRREEA